MRRGLLLAVLALPACGPAPTPGGTPSEADIADPAGALARLAGEPEGAGRRALVQAIRRASAEQALPVLRAGLVHPDPAMRSAAALAAGRRLDGAGLGELLLAAATGDTETSVRVAATRSLGLLRHGAAFVPLQQSLSHETAEIRLSALRALARIDPARTAALPELARLQLDADSRVAGAATKISRGVGPE
jgi:HEAT repeat protein